MRLRGGFVVVAAAAVLILPVLASAALGSGRQAAPEPKQAGSIFSGSLLDPTGRALPAVPLALVNRATGQKHETRTDEAGRFSIGGLPAGDYQIEVSKPPFSQVAGRVVLGQDQQLKRDVVPQLGGLFHKYSVPGKATNTNATAVTTPTRTVVRTNPPDDPCKGSTVAGCVTPPLRMVEAWPVYPRALLDKGVSGTVTVRARLGTDGFLKDLRPDEGAQPPFAAAAIEALQMWEYSVVRLNGIPHECPITVTFQFDAAKQ